MNFTSPNKINMKAHYRFTLLGIFGLTLLTSWHANAQSSMPSLSRCSRYVGFRITAGVENALIQSDIAKLNGVRLSSAGGSAGILLGNKKTFASASVGLYYSAESMRNSVDLFTGNIQTGVYLLRLNNCIRHTIEPYATASLNGIRSTFFGSYLPEQVSRSGMEKKLGAVNSLQTSAGLGFEYQLANNANDFVHLFVEAQYGYTVYQTASRKEFEDTNLRTPVSVRIGVTVGRTK
jgi:hypothetical protein